MVLRYRLILILCIAMALYVALAYLIQSKAVYPKFLVLEENYADQDLERAVNAIEREIDYIETFTHDWSSWDDTYNFIENGDEQYIEANFVDETFTENAMSIMYAVRLDGTVVYGKVMDLATESYITVPGLPQDKMPPDSPFLLEPDDLVGKGGLVLLEGRPALVAVMPILTTLSQGPSRGMLIFGKFLNDELIQSINA